MSFRSSRALRLLLAAALVVAAIAAIPSLREPVLRAIGGALVANDAVRRADVIVISLDSGGAGVLEAADLVREGVAARIAIFADPPSGDDFEFIRRGLPYDDMSARRIRQLELLGMSNIATIPSEEAGTDGEGRALPAWCDRNAVGSIVVVASRDHSRRLRRVFLRFMQGHATSVSIRASRYSPFDPDRWWQTRNGIRTALIELQKLALDIVLHPLG